MGDMPVDDFAKEIILLLRDLNNNFVIHGSRLKMKYRGGIIFPKCYGPTSDWYEGALDDESEPVLVRVWRGSSWHLRGEQANFIKHLHKQVQYWKNLDHENIARVCGFCTGFGGGLPSLVQPLYENGNAYRWVRDNPEVNIFHLLRGVATGLDHLHSQSPPIAHGSLKGSHILISKSGDPVLTGIGIGSLPYPPDFSSLYYQDPRWMAPELLIPEESSVGDVTRCNLEADVYSFGMTILELCTKALPYAHYHYCPPAVIDAMNNIKPPRPENVCDFLWMIIETCWSHDAKDRPTIGTVLSWLNVAQLDGLEEGITSDVSQNI